MDFYYDFSAYLGLATIITGGLWLLDSLLFKKKREAQYLSLIQHYELDAAAKDIKPDDLETMIEQKTEQDVDVPRMSKLADYSKAFFPVLLIVFLLRAFLAEPFRIPSGSMRPTLVEGDFILVNKFTYGWRLPLTATKISPWRMPERGDVLVFRNPKDTSIDFIKRVVGLPGDKVKVEDKVLYINGEPVELEYVESSVDTDITGISREIKHYKEQLNSTKHSIYVSLYEHGDYPETEIPEGHLFVMGDNRDFSRDSREWGFVPEKLILGKAVFIWLSIDMKNKDIRWKRLGAISKQEIE